ncbi:carbonic anhydrase [Pelosinus sp. sgz500959]|uniref:carbonic anhydrase n=1 Tax=Pelosinus sp. sgz500959 TaxID=3242472 RepID=UPI00366C337B
MFKKLSVFIVAMVLLMSTALANGTEVGVNADTAKQMLIDGNQRFVTEKHADINIGQMRREELTKGQHPFAIVVSCSDSRVPPELVFDEGLGDLFVIRTAGEVVDDVALGSIEYAVEHLGVKLVVVLGHEECGAVKATIAGGEVPGHIVAIAKAITPAVNQAKMKKGDLLSNSVKANVDMIVAKLNASEPIIKEKIEKDHVKVVGAVYELQTGKVVFR